MHEVSIDEISLNPMNLFGSDWALLCAGSKDVGANAMTIAWGNLGATWDIDRSKAVQGSKRRCMPTAVVYVRPSRYTKKFMDSEDFFSINAFSPTQENKKMLGYMGSHSGRDEDKFQACGLDCAFDEASAYVAQADMVFICRKLYAYPLSEEGFVDRSIIDKNYPIRDFHTMYVGEIVKVLAAG